MYVHVHNAQHAAGSVYSYDKQQFLKIWNNTGVYSIYIPNRNCERRMYTCLL